MQAPQVRLSLLLTLTIGLCWIDPGYTAYPAGVTNAVLSFVDAAGSHVSVNRHWPGYSQDVQVSPFTPYFWNSCLPGDGAIMILLTGPGYQPPIGTSAEAYTTQYLASLARRVAASLSKSPHAGESNQLRAIVAGLTIPGNPAYESLKEAMLWVNSLASYESYGYAVFLMIHWKWVFPFPSCYADAVTVPEGYGIPYVALNNSGKDRQMRLAAMNRLVLTHDIPMATNP